MLNFFPIQFLTPLSFLLIRITIGLVCVGIGYSILQEPQTPFTRKVFGIFFILIGIAFTFGIFTQLASLAALCVLLFGMYRPEIIPGTTRMTLFFMTVMSISLFITGAGPFAFDLPI